jgi:hypothetical protein
MVVRDDHAPRVDEQAEPVDLARARDGGVDHPDVANVVADDAAGHRECDGEEDLAVVPVEEL